eukprot:1160649-Pelagomonas_calceolata.AAC.11
MLPNRSSAAAEAAAPPDSRSSSSASAESQPLLQRLGIGGSTHADALSARVRSSATGSPASGAASTLSIDDPGEEQRPPRPQGDSGAWKYLVALCALSVVICYAGGCLLSAGERRRGLSMLACPSMGYGPYAYVCLSLAPFHKFVQKSSITRGISIVFIGAVLCLLHAMNLCPEAIADRSNMSTAILPMAEQFGWEKVSGWNVLGMIMMAVMMRG